MATLLQKEYPSAKIVYSKASNVSEFRNRKDKELPKFREINDLHHAKDAYLNIVVGNVYDTKFTEKFFLNIRNENYSLKRVFDFNVAGAWDAKGSTFDTVKKYMAKNNPIITFAPYEAKGKFFDQQIVSKGKGQVPIKQGMDISKYGGYNKRRAAYLISVEYLDKKKIKRSLEPVYIKDIDAYRENPIQYCETVLGLKNPRILIPKILMGTSYYVGGEKIVFKNIVDSRITYHHTYQLILNINEIKYLKNIFKYLQEVENLKEEDMDRITREQNVELFKVLCAKLAGSTYSTILRSVGKVVQNNRLIFENLSITDQCKILKEIIFAFRCNLMVSDLRKINGSEKTGILKMSRSISNNKVFRIIHQSITGLFEEEVDLLK